KISRMKSKERIRSEVYSVLDFIETKRPESIKRFWSCVFKETILNKYPTLRLLRNSLFDGTCGKSIRTESSWMTPVDFVKEASCQTDISWQKDIKCEGKPLGELLK
ncbi:hypothetical protein NL108_009058, partial [Boleophthalmus pectinirostris]